MISIEYADVLTPGIGDIKYQPDVSSYPPGRFKPGDNRNLLIGYSHPCEKREARVPLELLSLSLPPVDECAA